MTPLRSRIRDTGPGDGMLMGTFLTIPAPAAVEIVCASGPDFVCVDMEHGALGAETLENMLRAADLARVPALVRVPSSAPEPIGLALDCGAAGVLVPRIASGAEAKAVVDAARYPPEGRRGAGPGRATGYGRHIWRNIDRMRQDTVVALQIETCEALDNLDDILSVPGVDLIFIGPGDLGFSLAASPHAQSLDEAIAYILDKTHAAGQRTGVFTMTADDASGYRGRTSLSICGSDAAILATGFDAVFATVP